MKLSFVIPAYNEEAYIGDCLRSIFEETEGKSFDVEIIVVNNASSDRTKEVALSYPGVKVLDEARKGITFARQAGFMASTGDLIANIDADTRLPRGWLEKVFSEFSQNEKLVALSGPHISYDLPRIARIGFWIFYGFGYVVYLVNHYLLKKGAMLQGGNFILRRTALEKIGGFDLGISFYGEDSDIARRIQKEGRVKFTFSLPIYASGRRLKKEGMIKEGLKYAINYLWIIFRKKPFSQKYRDIR
jgi:glycosyltransferase involved in cell wall biosynthesis